MVTFVTDHLTPIIQLSNHIVSNHIVITLNSQITSSPWLPGSNPVDQCSPPPLLEGWDVIRVSLEYRLRLPGEPLLRPGNKLTLLWDPLLRPGIRPPLLMIMGGMLWARLMWLFRLYFRPNIIPHTIHRKGFNFRWTLLKCRLRFWAREEPRNTLPHTWHDTCCSFSCLGRCWWSPNSPFNNPEINPVLQFENWGGDWEWGSNS